MQVKWLRTWNVEPEGLNLSLALPPTKSMNQINYLTFVCLSWTYLVAQWYRIHLLIQETCTRLLGREDPLEKAIVTHSSIVTWKIPWTEETGRVTVHEVTKESGMT